MFGYFILIVISETLLDPFILSETLFRYLLGIEMIDLLDEYPDIPTNTS